MRISSPYMSADSDSHNFRLYGKKCSLVRLQQWFIGLAQNASCFDDRNEKPVGEELDSPRRRAAQDKGRLEQSQLPRMPGRLGSVRAPNSLWTDIRMLQSSGNRVTHSFLNMGIWTIVELDEPPGDTASLAPG